MKRSSFFSQALVVVALLIIPGMAQGGDQRDDRAAAVVRAVLKAYGGPDAIGSIRSVVAKGRIADFLNGTEGGYFRYYERPKKLRIEIMPDQQGEVRILDGDHGWQASPQGFVKVSPLMLQSMIYQYSYLDLPMGLAHGTYAVTYGGRQKLGNREVQVLFIDLRDAPRLRVAIDATTHLIVRVSADFAMGMMGASELATEYHDFHPTNGVLFPHRLVNYAGDTRLSEIVLSDIRTNVNIPASLFSPPR